MTLRILRVLGLSSVATPPTNYAAVNEGRKEFTHEGVAIQVPLVHAVDETGASIAPLTAAQLGSDGDDAPANPGEGLRGWLRGIFERLGGTLSVSASSLPLPSGAAKEAQQIITNAGIDAINTAVGARADDAAESDTAEASLIAFVKRLTAKLKPDADGNLHTAVSKPLPAGTNNIGHVTAVRKTDEASTYFASGFFFAGASAAGAAYWVLRNTSQTTKIKLKKIRFACTFTGTTGPGRNIFSFSKGVATGVSGITAVVPSRATRAAPASVAQVGHSSAGLTFTASSFEAPLDMFAHLQQLVNVSYERDFSDAPILLNENEMVVIQAANSVLAGSTLAPAFEWTEE